MSSSRNFNKKGASLGVFKTSKVAKNPTIKSPRTIKPKFNSFPQPNYKRNLRISGIIILIAAAIFAIYYFTFSIEECKDLTCYQNNLFTCNKATYINEDETSVWRYSIKGKYDDDFCDVEVRLLKIKHGQISVESLQDKTMICQVVRSGDDFPEKDMTSCSGPLKEDLQEIIIERIHNYLLQNLGEIQENLKAI
jgi:hypothetical protein